MKSAKPKKSALVRASIGFPTELYQALEDLASRKKVSLAWVVRDAAELYLRSESRNVNEGDGR